MAHRITFNSNNIDLLIGPEGLDPVFLEKNYQERAASGKIETLNIYNFGGIFTFDCYFQEAVYRQLVAFHAWAEKGKSFSFAFDSSLVGNTTLDAAAASGQKVIPLTATAAFSVGDIGFIRTANLQDYELVDIDVVNAGASVEATDNLYYTYASGDTFRHWKYWPDLVLPAGERFNPPKEGNYYHHTFRFIENL